MPEKEVTRPLRCVHYLPLIALEEGGLVRSVFDLCRVMAARGTEITLITYDTRDAPEAWLRGEPGCPKVVKVDGPVLPRQILGRRSLSVAAEHIKQADLVHVHGPFILSSVQVGNLAHKLGKPYIFTVHGMLDDWSMSRGTLRKRLFLSLWIGRCLERAARVHCTARAELEQAKQWFPRGWGVVHPYVIDTQPFEHLPGPDAARQAFPALNKRGPIVLFLSRLHPKKGIETLIRAVERMRESGMFCRLVVAGPSEPDYLAKLRKLVHSLRLDDAVDFLGMVGGETKLSLYQAADVMALPTNQENFGLVLVESMACGTPVVTTFGVDIWQELESAGAIVCDATTDAFATALRDVLSQPDAIEHRGAMGRKWVMEKYNPSRVAARYEAMYREVAGGTCARDER